MPERLRFGLVLLACLGLSVGGVLFAAYYMSAPSHGGRGGALAVALALTLFFLSDNSSDHVYGALTEKTKKVRRILSRFGAPKQDLDSISLTADERLEAFEARLRMDAEGVRLQNFFIALSTGLGTIFWGFGDLVAEWLIALN